MGMLSNRQTMRWQRRTGLRRAQVVPVSTGLAEEHKKIPRRSGTEAGE